MATKQKHVRMPYDKGSVLDDRALKGALGRFGALAAVCVAHLLMSTVMSMDSVVLRCILDTAIYATVALLFYSGGVSAGTVDVEIGERVHNRAEEGKEVSAHDRRRAFHPLKGLTVSVLGTIPLLLCAVYLACNAVRLQTGFGTLPDWMSSYSGRVDLAGGLVAYSVRSVAGVLDYIRIIIRLMIMPLVAMVTTENSAGILTLERLSPLLVLVPAFAYGLGYLRGPSVRSRVHTAIAKNNRRRKKAEKRREAARRASMEKNQLN